MKPSCLHLRIEDLVENTGLHFERIDRETSVSLIGVQFDISDSTATCFLSIRHDTPSFITFQIPYPLNLTEKSKNSFVKYCNLINTQSNYHPGHWIMDIDNKQLQYYYRWYCDATGHQFDSLFREALIGCITTFIDCSPGITKMNSGEATPEEAVRMFLKIKNAWKN
ncbi:MAG: hypothetical protein Q8T08_18420 [Ignavibacteria bacterium]|nr:hypothetical protein [Ignavibacteria bacterium]